jgi:hemerythrin-like domain-containing protein
MPGNKPIRRSPELTPLSHDHHDALLLVFKIRQGLNKMIEPERIMAFIIWFWEHHLEKHFRDEEHYLAPLVDPGHEGIWRMFREHKELKEIFVQLKSEPDSSMLKQFAQSLNDHIRFEERELFPFIEQSVSAGDLQDVFRKLSADEKICSVWEDEFWSRI